MLADCSASCFFTKKFWLKQHRLIISALDIIHAFSYIGILKFIEFIIFRAHTFVLEQSVSRSSSIFRIKITLAKHLIELSLGVSSCFFELILCFGWRIPCRNCSICSLSQLAWRLLFFRIVLNASSFSYDKRNSRPLIYIRYILFFKLWSFLLGTCFVLRLHLCNSFKSTMLFLHFFAWW